MNSARGATTPDHFRKWLNQRPTPSDTTPKANRTSKISAPAGFQRRSLKSRHHPVYRRLILYLLLCLPLAGTPPARAGSTDSTLRLCFEDKESLPYIEGSGTHINWEHPGLSLELLQEVGIRLQLQLQFVRAPWKRCLQQLRYNEIDATFHATYRPEREAFAVYPMRAGKPDVHRRMIDNAYYLYRLRGAAVQWDGERLETAGAPVGAVIGYAIVGVLREQGILVEETPTQLSNLEKLLAGRIIGYAGLQTLVDPLIAASPGRFATVEKVEPPLRSSAYYLVFSRGFHARQPELAAQVWDEIAELREAGFAPSSAAQNGLPHVQSPAPAEPAGEKPQN